MKRIALAHVLIFQLLIASLTASVSIAVNYRSIAERSISADQDGLLISPQPIYIRLQAQQEGNIAFWESIPQNFADHVATVNVTVLAILISSGGHAPSLQRDSAGNLWLTAVWSLNKGDYMSSLVWVASRTSNENLTIPDSVPFPDRYPDDVKPFLEPGKKIPVDNATIRQLAELLRGSDMIETIRSILSYVNGTQTYDREKVRLLMNGALNITDILDFINDPTISLETGTSFCFERALLATTMLRAVGVPTRTFTNVDLKTWIQVWLPDTGWVDAEVLCTEPQPMFPRPLSFSVPRLVENSSDAMFPFTWTPKTLMRVANLTLSDLKSFDVNEYRTIFCQPVGVETYESDPDKFSFPVISESKLVQAALTQNGSDLAFHLADGEKKASQTLKLGETNSLELEGLTVSFRPTRQNGMILLNDFLVQRGLIFDFRILIFLIALVSVIIVALLYWKLKKIRA